MLPLCQEDGDNDKNYKNENDGDDIIQNSDQTKENNGIADNGIIGNKMEEDELFNDNGNISVNKLINIYNENNDISFLFANDKKIPVSNLNKGNNSLLNSIGNNDVNLEVKDDGNLLLENSIYYKK